MAEFPDDDWYAEEAETPGPGDVIDERFELERFAGRGAMAEVFRARDRFRDESVAVKARSGRAVLLRRLAFEGTHNNKEES